MPMTSMLVAALALAAPNDVLETNFLHGRDMLIYRSLEELAEMTSFWMM